MALLTMVPVTVTNAFKQASKAKTINAGMFVAHYENGDYYKLHIEHNDGKTKNVLTIDGQEFRNLINSLL